MAGGLVDIIRNIDFHRKVPRDVTEATVAGGAVSVCAVIVALWLLLGQVSTFATMHTTTTLHIDSSPAPASTGLTYPMGANPALDAPTAHPLLISFNLTLPHVPCALASLDAVDHRGMRRVDRRRTVFRMRVAADGRPLGLYQNPLVAQGALAHARRGAKAHSFGADASGGNLPGTRAAGPAKGRRVAHKREAPAAAAAAAAEAATATPSSPTSRTLLAAEEVVAAAEGGEAAAGAGPPDGDSSSRSPGTGSPADGPQPVATAGDGPAAGVAGPAEGEGTGAPGDGAAGVDAEGGDAAVSTDLSGAGTAASDAAGTPSHTAEAAAASPASASPVAAAGDAAAATAESSGTQGQGAGERGDAEVGGRAGDVHESPQAGAEAGADSGSGADAGGDAGVGGGGGASGDEDFDPGDPDSDAPLDLNTVWSFLGETSSVRAGAARVAAPPMDLSGFSDQLARHDAVVVNFFAPWCRWSQLLAPDWEEAAARLARRAYGRDGGAVGMLRVDCTHSQSRFVCMHLGISAYPSIRVYKYGSLASYEPYDDDRSVEGIWRLVVARACDVLAHAVRRVGPSRAAVAARRKELEDATRDMALVLRLAKMGAYQGLERSQELQEEMEALGAARQELLGAVFRLINSKAKAGDGASTAGEGPFARGQRALRAAEDIRATLPGANARGAEARTGDEEGGKAGVRGFGGHGYDFLNTLLDEDAQGRLAAEAPREGARVAEDAANALHLAHEAAGHEAPAWLRRLGVPGEPLPVPVGAEGDAAAVPRQQHLEGCNLFGSVEAARAPGQLHVTAHSHRQSVDLTLLNVTHHVDHFAFGQPLPWQHRKLLPDEIAAHLVPLDGTTHTAEEPHVSIEHYLRVSPTSYRPAGHPTHSPPVSAHQFVATTHRHAKEATPAVLITYDVSPIRVDIREERMAVSQLLLSMCAIVGGVVSFFGLCDGALHSGARAIGGKL